MDSVIGIMREKQNKSGHPAVFPVALPEAMLRSYTHAGEILYDPFCGSGSSAIAAEQTGRICYAMEIEPSYCQIAVDRWRKRKPKQTILAI